jgi:hypothetical protein
MEKCGMMDALRPLGKRLNDLCPAESGSFLTGLRVCCGHGNRKKETRR